MPLAKVSRCPAGLLKGTRDAGCFHVEPVAHFMFPLRFSGIEVRVDEVARRELAGCDADPRWRTDRRRYISLSKADTFTSNTIHVGRRSVAAITPKVGVSHIVN